MRRYLMTFAAAGLAVAAMLAGPPAGAGTVTGVTGPNGVWGKAEEAPGTAALNKGGNAGTESLSCATAGNCSAGGSYTDRSGHFQAFVISQAHGVWGTAEEVPGTAALNKGGAAGTDSVSCASAGNCSAGGFYASSSSPPPVGVSQAFVDTEVKGTWGTAEEVPGTAALNTGGQAFVTSLSCASAGNCSAGGFYNQANGNGQAFVASQAHGVWGQAEEVPGTAKLNTGGRAYVNDVSCGSTGNCSAGGYYRQSSGHVQAFVVSQVNGVWGTAEEPPGTAALNKDGNAAINSLSCATAGNCSAGGSYTDRSGHFQAFVISQAHGVWGTAEEVPGTAALNKGGAAEIDSVSCATAGNCSAGGFYESSSSPPPEGTSEVFVVTEVKGTWGKAEEVPGSAALNQGGDAGINSVSCASAGNCSAGGVYTGAGGRTQAFVISQAHGTWGQAEEVPGTAALNKGGAAEIDSLSCATAGNCSAGGDYASSSSPPPEGTSQAFVVTEVNSSAA